MPNSYEASSYNKYQLVDQRLSATECTIANTLVQHLHLSVLTVSYYVLGITQDKHVPPIDFIYFFHFPHLEITFMMPYFCNISIHVLLMVRSQCAASNHSHVEMNIFRHCWAYKLKSSNKGPSCMKRVCDIMICGYEAGMISDWSHTQHTRCVHQCIMRLAYYM